MQQKSALTLLVPLIAILAVFMATMGLFASNVGDPFTFTNVHGQTVEMFGRGLYKNDSLLAGAGFRGTDAVTLLVAIPILLITYFSSLRGSQNGRILLIGSLFFFLYNSASMTFSAAFNPMFLVYTALFSVSLFATITALVAFDIQSLVIRIQKGFPHRGLAIFTFIAGLGTLFIWLSELVGPLINGTVPTTIGPYTTMFTHGFDSAVITPAAILTGVLLLQRKPLGYLLIVPILTLCAQIGVVIIGQTISQASEGLIFPIGVYIGMVGSWVLMGGFAIGLVVKFFNNLSKSKD
jgi:hypothetical protein